MCLNLAFLRVISATTDSQESNFLFFRARFGMDHIYELVSLSIGFTPVKGEMFIEHGAAPPPGSVRRSGLGLE